MNTARLLLTSLASLALIAPASLAQGQRRGCGNGQGSQQTARCGNGPANQQKARAGGGQKGARTQQASRQRSGAGRCGSAQSKAVQPVAKKQRGNCGDGCQGSKSVGQGRQTKQVLVSAQVSAQPAPVLYIQRLQDILKEELYARDFYTAAAETTRGRRYGNLARAEARHANAIASAIRTLGGTPILEHAERIDLAKTQTEADGTCREIELKVIEVYKGLIKDCPDPSLIPMLENIQEANYRHLNAVGGGSAPGQKGPRRGQR